MIADIGRCGNKETFQDITCKKTDNLEEIDNNSEEKVEDTSKDDVQVLIS